MIRDNQKFNESVKTNSSFLNELSQKLPEFFIDNEFDIEKFTFALKEQNIEELSNGYRLDFIGKNYAKKQAGEQPNTVIVPDKDHNEKKENRDSGNLFLTGDNLEVLRHLQQNYSNSVDFIYIDPPYNTGSDGFVYPDKFEYNDEQLANMFGLNEDELKRLKSIQGKATHSSWLAFMYPRLYLAKKLLKDTGTIFISIDDNEQANLKLLMDDVFGEGGFIAEFIHKNNSSKNQANLVSVSTEYILSYAKNINKLSNSTWRIPKKGVKDVVKLFEKLKESNYKNSEILEEVKELYSRPKYSHLSRWNKIDDKGIFKDADLSRQNGPKNFTIINPKTNRPVVIPERGWGKSKVELERLQKEGLIYYGDEKTPPGMKDYIAYDDISVPDNFWYFDNSVDTRAIRNYFGDIVFDNPKPVAMISQLISMALRNIDSPVVLDFFAGSSTTAEAVVRLNVEDGGNRKFIMCTLPEPTFKVNSDEEEIPTKGGKVAYEMGFKSIDEISRERIVKAVAAIKEENPSVAETQDLGFKHYRVVSATQEALNKIDYDDNMQLDMFDDMISLFSSEKLGIKGNADGFDTILQTYLVKDNYKFDVSVERLNFSGIELPYVNNQRLYIISNNWQAENTKALVNAIGTNEITVQTIVVYGYTIEMESLRELEIALSQLENKVNLQVRY